MVQRLWCPNDESPATYQAGRLIAQRMDAPASFVTWHCSLQSSQTRWGFPMPVSEQTFLQLALEEPGQWELHCGNLRRKPPMTFAHNDLEDELAYTLRGQLDRSQFRVRSGKGHVRRSSESYYIPDVFVVPIEATQSLRGRSDVLEAYADPLPLVVEIWSPSTGDYDVDSKLPEYQRRGDLEIWRLHPYDRTLTAWQRQPDGSYLELLFTGGTVQPIALPGVTIDLDRLFE
jgi:Uma2 family endonuclease